MNNTVPISIMEDLSGAAWQSIWQDGGSYPSGLGRKPVPVRFQLVIDCADPDRLARF
jgi:hypothetical protein